MNIAFDATAILGPMSKNRGIGNYGLAQFREMIRQDKCNHYFFFNIFEPFSIGDFPNLTEEYFNCGKDKALLNVQNNKVMEALIQQFLHKNKIDVFYITSPFDAIIPVYRKEWFKEIKTVVTVYDIIPYIFKDHYFTPNGDIPQWYEERIEMLRWVDKILVISQSVKDDLVSFLNFNGDNIEVIWGAPSDMFQKIEVSEQEQKAIRKKYKLKDRFIMCTGGDDERKNIAGLIEAYGKLPLELTAKYGLAIVCKLQDVSVKRYKALAQEYGVSKEVVLTNFVSDKELVQLYNMSTLVAFPSKYEGFGLPVTEAWACGKPVLTANNSSLCQIAGDAATLVNANDVEDIAKGLEVALKEENLKIMSTKGEKRVKQFQWPVVAGYAIKCINQLKSTIPEKVGVPNLAFFTPLPPQQSGIADYSVDILCELSDYFLIDVYIDDGYQVECELPKSIHIMNHRKFPQNVKRYNYILYQMGNSLYHYYMYPYLKKYGGILVLHDYNMHGVAQYIGLNMKHDDFRTYKSFLEEDLDAEEVSAIINKCKQGIWPDIKIEINGFVTNFADKIIVHNQYALENLLRKNIGRTVVKIPHYTRISPLSDTKEAKIKLGIDPHNLVIASFGHIHETKRAIPLLKAGIQFLEVCQEAELVFVGKLDESIYTEFNKLYRESKVADRIKVTGYTALEEFYNYIDAADICFNLRYPYNGESSGVFARCLARGKCIVVNNVGSFGEVPDECCIKLAPVESLTLSEEINQIYQTMKQLSDASLRETIGKAARTYAERELDLKVVSSQYREFVCSHTRNAISEETLANVYAYMVKDNHRSDDEIREISKTLAYCVKQ